MDTIRSPKDFSRALSEKLLELLWGQWSILGIASYGRKPALLIDLEALILATEAAGNADQRLMASSRQWLMSFREWINLSRLKRMSRGFILGDPLIKTPLIQKTKWEGLLDDLDSKQLEDSEKSALINKRNDSVVTPPQLKKPSLGQLYLRGVFGVNARAEIYLYLSLEAKGNSTRIAREIHYDQRNVYRILERWTEAGLVVRESRLKENLYSLAPNQRFRELGAGVFPYWHWNDFFLLFARISAASSIPPWAEDAYLFSSLCRDLYPLASIVASSAKMSFPDPDLHVGQEYFEPFAQALLAVLDRFGE